MSTEYRAHKEDLAGFDLFGYYRDGRYHMPSGAILDELPEELEFLDNTYTLEEMVWGREVKGKGQFFNAVYV